MDMIMAMMMKTAMMVKMMMMMEVTRPAFTHSFLGTILGPPQQTVFNFCKEEKHLKILYLDLDFCLCLTAKCPQLLQWGKVSFNYGLRSGGSLIFLGWGALKEGFKESLRILIFITWFGGLGMIIMIIIMLTIIMIIIMLTIIILLNSRKHPRQWWRL